MTDTPNLGLPFIEGGQAQKHVTHNEALRILDAAIQIAVQDTTRTAPPPSPEEGQRHVVAAGAGGAWAGQGHAIASFQDGAWAFLAPKRGWCVWSVADDSMLVFDGAGWRAVGLPALDSVGHLGINTSADASNLLSVKSAAALFAAIDTAAGGSGDVRLQLSKESASNTASVVFADNYSGRAEFGLVGSDAFKLKVSPDGSTFAEALAIDQATGNLTLPRGVALTGVCAPSPLTASQNDYAPAGLATAGVLQISAAAPRSLSGLAGGAEGRVVVLVNVGSQPITLLDDHAASVAANRFALGGNLTLAGRRAALLRYDGTAARWQALAGGLFVRADAAQALDGAQQAQARANLGIAPVLRSYLAGLTLSTPGASGSFAVAAGVAADSGHADLLSLAASITKTTATLWAAGSGNGGLDSGTMAANSWYHVHLIKRPDTGAVDALFSLSATAPVLPSNYTLFRRIGALRANAVQQWARFSQHGDEFLWDLPTLDINFSGSTALQVATLSVPTGVRVNALIAAAGIAPGTGAGQGRAWIMSPDTNSAGALAATTNFNVGIFTSASGSQNWGMLNVRTNNAAQVYHSSEISTMALLVTTHGWIDTRGRNA